MCRRLRIAIGDAGNEAMLRAMRLHSYFVEYVPLSLLLLYLVVQSGASSIFVHVLGASMLVGRAAHVFGVSRVNENLAFRVFGMAMTLTPLIAASICLLLFYAS